MSDTVTSTPEVTIEVHLFGLFAIKGPQGEPAAATPLCLAGQGVHGKVNLKCNETFRPTQPRDIVKVSLQGSSRIRVPIESFDINDKVQPYAQAQSSFLNLVEVLRIDPAASSANEATANFSFVLPKVVAFSIEDASCGKQSSLWSPLPSSLSAESIVTTDMNGRVQRVLGKILYTIRVQVFRQNRCIGSTLKDVRVYNDVGIQPPVCLKDFPSDYQCQQQSAFRRHFRKTGASLTAVAVEPPPFVFCNNEDSASTTLCVALKLHLPDGQDSRNVSKISPGAIDAMFAWRLKYLTFLSPQPLTSAPSIAQSWGRHSTSVITVVGQKHYLNWTLKSWKDANVESPGSIWTETAQLPLFLTKPVLPAPPLFTPFISRRYNLCLLIRLSGTQSGGTTVRLEIPLHIAYQQEKGDPPAYLSQTVPASNGDEPTAELPIYVP